MMKSGKTDSLPETSAEGRYHGKFARKKKRGLRWLWILLGVLVLIAAGTGITVYALYKTGQKNMLVRPDNVVIAVPEQQKSVIVPMDEGVITYQGKKYKLNDKITTILFIGVDRADISETEERGAGGQADVNVLVALDTATGKMVMVSFPRDTYAEIDRYSADGYFLGTKFAQLALAYANGNGREESCERQKSTIQRLLYGMPIQAYVALDVDGIIAANEAVGGVTVTTLEDIQFPVLGYRAAGSEVTLHGKDANKYIRTREWSGSDVNVPRMARQKQYMQAFLEQVISKSKSDITVPVQLFQTLSRYMVTDLTASDVTFLSTCFLQNGAQFEFASLSYEIEQTEEKGILYYLDEDVLLQTVVDIFYVPVE